MWPTHCVFVLVIANNCPKQKILWEAMDFWALFKIQQKLSYGCHLWMGLSSWGHTGPVFTALGAG